MIASVIITVYNLEKYIESAITSVLEQSYSDIELIIVDDCSTDQSTEIIKNYSSKAKIIQTKENSGVLLATIEGIMNATGDVICFLDGDDLWHKDKVLKIMEKFQKDEHTIMVSHDYEYINENNKHIEKKDSSQNILKKNLLNQAFVSNTMRNSILGYYGNVWLGSAYCFRNNQKLINEFKAWALQLPYPKFTYQDHPLATFYVAYNFEGKIAYVNQKLLSYRIHENNYSGAYHNRESARKLAFKAYNTSMATLSIVQSKTFKDAPALIKRQKAKALYYEFLLSLLDKKFIKAFVLNFKLTFNFYSFKTLTKEWVRYFGILFLGNTFFKIMNK